MKILIIEREIQQSAHIGSIQRVPQLVLKVNKAYVQETHKL